MTESIDDLIARLRHDVLVGGGRADIADENLEKLFAEIALLRLELKGASEKLHQWGKYSEPSAMLLADLADEIDLALSK